MRYLGCSIYLGLGFYRNLSSLDVIFIDDELKGAVLIILEVLEPIVKIVPKALIRLNKIFRHARTSTLSRAPSIIIRCVLITGKIGCLLAVGSFLGL